MKRTQEREQAFIMVFEKEFNSEVDTGDLFAYAYEVGNFEKSDFCELLVKAVFENIEKIDGIISEYAVGWKINHLPKVTLAILRLALCEILYVDSIPESVTVNEAVELAKTYGGESDASYINGILGKFLRDGRDE